jgi:hypothetical protein
MNLITKEKPKILKKKQSLKKIKEKMKKILSILLVAFALTANAQRNYEIENQLKLKTVNQGTASDSVLVRGADKIVKYVPRSEFGGDIPTTTGLAPISYVDSQDATKQNTLFSGTNIKTVNGTSLLGSGNLTIGAGITGIPNKVTKINSSGNGVVDSSIADTGSSVLISNPVEINSTTTGTSGLKFTNLLPTVSQSTSSYGTGGSYPWRIIVDNSGTIYAADRTDGTVIKTPIGGPSTVLATPGGYVSDLVMDALGNVIVSIRNSGILYKITPAGAITTFVTTGGSSTTSLLTTSNGDMFALDNTVNQFTVYKITSTGVATPIATKSGLTTNTAPELCYNTLTGDLYVLWNKDIYKVTQNGTLSLLINIAGLSGVGNIMCIDPLGNLYLTGLTSNTKIYKVTPLGVLSDFAVISTSGWTIESDDSGNIYSTGPGNIIQKTTPSGVTTTIGTVNASPYCIAIDKNKAVYTANKSSKTYSRIVQPYTRDILTVGPLGNVVVNDNIFTDNTGNVYLPNSNTSIITGTTSGTVVATRDYVKSITDFKQDKVIGTDIPSSSSAAGTVGEVRVCLDGYIYWTTSANTWVRAAGSTF